ncbi:MAG TPA: response regulator [Anaeromyxobacteraceae bacterium]|nr:response regulator [Anaeromyxobacteraceae bacterium]
MRKPRILVVDDKEPMLDLLTTILASYHVVTAANGPRAALALLGPPFEVALVDVRLPGADGHEILQAVKTVSPDTEVVMMTAYATVPDAVAGMREGAFDYLEKPFDPDDVNLVVARALENRRQKLAEAARRMEVAGEGAGARGESQPSRVWMTYREAAEAGRDRASRSYLVALMREFGGRVTAAADRAGMERESLSRLLRRYGVRSEDFKPPPHDRPDAGARRV